MQLTLSNGLFAGMALALSLSAAACMKTNSNYCEVETGNNPVPDEFKCDPGFVCDGDTKGCVPVGGEACTVSSECQLAAPYCVGSLPDLACSDMCLGDTSCDGAPGVTGQFCVSGTCGVCRPSDSGETAEGCESGMPVCDVDSLECRKCEADAECSSGVCDLEAQYGGAMNGTGACVAVSDVIYASPTGMGDCSSEMSSCTLQAALVLVNNDDPRKVIVLIPDSSGASFSFSDSFAISKDVTLVGLGESREAVVIKRASEGAVVTIGNAKVAMRNLSVTGGHGTDANGVECSKKGFSVFNVDIHDNDGKGINATGSCALTVSQSTFSGNQGGGISSSSSGALTVSHSTFSTNQGGGISSSGPLTVSQSTFSTNQGGGIAVNGSPPNRIQNCYIVENGFGTISWPGISFGIGRTATLEFNTISANADAGVFCSNTAVIAKDNIVYANAVTSGHIQFSPLCGGFTNSDDNHNYAAGFGQPSPNFTNMGIGAAKYHLTDASDLVLGKGVAISDITTDFDGDARDGIAPDIGADEFVDGL